MSVDAGNDDGLDFNLEEIDFSAFQDDSQGPATSTDAAPVQDAVTPENSGNPAWNEYLEKIPAGMHTLVKPAFEAWDQNVQRRFQEINQQWEPYKRFRDEQVDPEFLMQARSFAEKLQQDPVSVYASLHQFFQQSPQHMQQLVQMGLIPDPNAQAPQPKQQEDGEVEADDPFDKIRSLEKKLEDFQRQQLEALENQQLEQQFNETYENTVQAIDQDFSKIEQKLGLALPGTVKAEMVKHAQYLGQKEQRYVSVIEAAPHVLDFMRKARAGVKSAPRPVGSGSIPQSPTFDPVNATTEDRIAYARSIAEQNRD